MKLKEKDVWSRIEIIAKQVEELSELKTDINGFELKLLSRSEIIKSGEEDSYLQRFVGSYYETGSYFVVEKDEKFTFTMSLAKNYPGNKDKLNLTIGHELMHHAQYFTNPKFLWKSHLARISEDPTRKEEAKTYRKLIEGDAELIEGKLRKIYYQNPIMSVPTAIYFWFNYNGVKEHEGLYGEPSEILQKEFGNDRSKINKLYTLPWEALAEIFNQPATPLN